MDNVYAPPQAAVSAPSTDRPRHPFFVVAPRKLLVLTVASFGWYLLYWWYMHWARQRRVANLRVQPAARALFSFVFVHSFVRHVNRTLIDGGRSHRWRGMWLATGYVLLALAWMLLTLPGMNEAGGLLLHVAKLVAAVPIALLLMPMQHAANVAAGDPQAQANRTLTSANWIWLSLFGVVWLANLALVALLLVNGAIPIDVQLPAA